MTKPPAHRPIDWEEEEARVAAQSLASGDPTGWFERPYAALADSSQSGTSCRRPQVELGMALANAPDDSAATAATMTATTSR